MQPALAHPSPAPPETDLASGGRGGSDLPAAGRPGPAARAPSSPARASLPARLAASSARRVSDIAAQEAAAFKTLVKEHAKAVARTTARAERVALALAAAECQREATAARARVKAAAAADAADAAAAALVADEPVVAVETIPVTAVPAEAEAACLAVPLPRSARAAPDVAVALVEPPRDAVRAEIGNGGAAAVAVVAAPVVAVAACLAMPAPRSGRAPALREGLSVVECREVVGEYVCAHRVEYGVAHLGDRALRMALGSALETIDGTFAAADAMSASGRAAFAEYLRVAATLVAASAACAVEPARQPAAATPSWPPPRDETCKEAKARWSREFAERRAAAAAAADAPQVARGEALAAAAHARLLRQGVEPHPGPCGAAAATPRVSDASIYEGDLIVAPPRPHFSPSPRLSEQLVLAQMSRRRRSSSSSSRGGAAVGVGDAASTSTLRLSIGAAAGVRRARDDDAVESADPLLVQTTPARSVVVVSDGDSDGSGARQTLPATARGCEPQHVVVVDTSDDDDQIPCHPAPADTNFDTNNNNNDTSASGTTEAIAAAAFARLLREGVEANPGPPARTSSAPVVVREAPLERLMTMAERQTSAIVDEEKRAFKALRDAFDAATSKIVKRAARNLAAAERQRAARVASAAAAEAAVATPRTPKAKRPAPAAAAPAAAGAAVAEVGGVPRIAPADPLAFYTSWCRMQPTANTAMTLVFDEDVEERVGGTWLPARRRRVILRLSGAAMTTSCAHKAVADGYCAAERELNPLTAPQTRRVGRLLRFPSCHALVADGTAYVEYGRFPLIPGEPSAAVGERPEFRATYVGAVQLLPADEAALLPPLCSVTADAPFVAAPGSRGARLWEASFDTSDAVVDATLGELGRALPLLRRVDDGTMRQAFRQLAATAIRGYREADTAGRDAKLRRLIALPRMHLRRLVGTATRRVREQHAMQQLSGAVCEQGVAVAPAHGSRRRAAPSDAELDALCVRSAYKLAAEGLVGRAAAALARSAPVDIPADQKLADLAALHPDGEKPAHVALLAEPLFKDEHVHIAELRKSVRAAMNGSAPGPDGWTFELLGDALENDAFAADFQAVVVDICNGCVTRRTARVLAASALVGIPKGKTAADGTRPIALGSALLKVAATAALRVARPELEARFRGSQFGCSAKGGADFIVHATRRFLRTGQRPNGSAAGKTRVVATIDFANAFNTPSRQAMWEATRDIPALIGIFAVSYAEHSALHVVGCDAELVSACGARQGTVDGPVTFALTLQAVINAVNAVAGVQVLAYLDDLTLLADSMEAAERAVTVVVTAAAALGLTVKTAKCELLPSDESAVAPEGTIISQFRRVNVVKLLGASIALRDADEAAHLLARMDGKASTTLRRLRHGASPQLFEVLRKCIVPQLTHAARVHSPAASRTLLQRFDAQVEDVVAYWAGSPTFAPRQRLIMGLPRAMGGMGLTRVELIAGAAHHASLTAALGGQRRILDQSALCAVVYRDVASDAMRQDAELARHLHVMGLDGSDAALSCLAARVHPDVFGAHLRTVLLVDSRLVAPGTPALTCRGCSREFATGGAWGHHVSGCVIGKGGMVTRRHNAVVGLLRRNLAQAGFSPEASEPRDLASYNCRCGLTLQHSLYIEHRKTCAQATREPLHVSGPDIRYAAAGTTVVADVTILGLEVASHAGQTCEAAFDAARATKVASYGALCARAGVQLLPLPATANGHLGREMVTLANACSDRCLAQRPALRALLSATIAHGSAAARLAAEERAGVRPPSIALEYVQLAERFRIAPERVDDAAGDDETKTKARPALPPLLPTPMSLEERVALGIPRELREMLDKLAERWVAAARDEIRRALEQERAEARAAGGDAAAGAADAGAADEEGEAAAAAPAGSRAASPLLRPPPEFQAFHDAVLERTFADDVVAKAVHFREAELADTVGAADRADAAAAAMRRSCSERVAHFEAQAAAAKRVADEHEAVARQVEQTFGAITAAHEAAKVRRSRSLAALEETVARSDEAALEAEKRARACEAEAIAAAKATKRRRLELEAHTHALSEEAAAQDAVVRERTAEAEALLEEVEIMRAETVERESRASRARSVAQAEEQRLRAANAANETELRRARGTRAEAERAESAAAQVRAAHEQTFQRYAAGDSPAAVDPYAPAPTRATPARWAASQSVGRADAPSVARHGSSRASPQPQPPQQPARTPCAILGPPPAGYRFDEGRDDVQSVCGSSPASDLTDATSVRSAAVPRCGDSPVWPPDHPDHQAHVNVVASGAPLSSYAKREERVARGRADLVAAMQRGDTAH
ncbi:MAG: reverse transcriptase domain-containing protein [bacterium]